MNSHSVTNTTHTYIIMKKVHKRTFFKDKIKSGANRTANLTFIKIRTQTQAHTDPAKGF